MKEKLIEVIGTVNHVLTYLIEWLIVLFAICMGGYQALWRHHWGCLFVVVIGFLWIYCDFLERGRNNNVKH
jgi:hypothetical protein